MSAAKARPLVEHIVMNKKKGEQITRKRGSPTSLEAVGTAMGAQVLRADSISFASPIIPNVGQEPKVIGASFNKQWLNKLSTPIQGNGGVYVIRPESVSAVPNADVNVEQQRTAMEGRMKSMSG